MRALTFCDVATFYCRTGGGIRTYYDAKLDWFRRQQHHHYVLIVPGARSSVRALTPWVTVVEARGIELGRGPDGYRIFVDYSRIRAIVRHSKPDVLEAGDPWVSGPLALYFRRKGAPPRVVSSFFHSDPIPTYVTPLNRRPSVRCLSLPASRLASVAFYRLQALYDVTIVTSRCLEARLRQEGVTDVRRAPFGVDVSLFGDDNPRPRIDRPRRLLYVGRLDRDKQVDLLLAVLTRVLENPQVSVTVVGTGALRPAFEAWTHPRYRYAGYVRTREALRAIYSEHDVLLAPGAYETFGLAALEAAAAGLIVVGPDAGGTGDLLNEMSSPFMFSAGDAESFLSAVRAALEADWAQASQESRALAARYGTWPDAIARLVGTYERIVEALPMAGMTA